MNLTTLGTDLFHLAHVLKVHLCCRMLVSWFCDNAMLLVPLIHRNVGPAGGPHQEWHFRLKVCKQVA